jgi:hypothetical protein
MKNDFWSQSRIKTKIVFRARQQQLKVLGYETPKSKPKTT